MTAGGKFRKNKETKATKGTKEGVEEKRFRRKGTWKAVQGALKRIPLTSFNFDGAAVKIKPSGWRFS